MAAGDANSPVFSFSSLDYEGVYNDLVRFAQQIFPEDLWTDFNDSNFGTFLLQMMAYATDLVAYNMNAQALETIAFTAQREQNFRNIARSLDYTLKSASASSTTVRFLLDSNSALYPMTITTHVKVGTADKIIFQPDVDTAVSAFPVAGYVDISMTQGEEHYLELLGYSNGQPSQSFALAYANVLDGQLSVAVSSSSWTLVDNIISASSTDEVFTVTTDEDGISTITFGDGVNGKIPPATATLTATYKTGGGSSTTLPAGTITYVYGTSDGSSVPAAVLSVTNPVAASGGGPKESLTSARASLPLSLKANDRGVTTGDYAALALKYVAGVFKAYATNGRYTNGSVPVLLFVVPQGGTDTDPPTGPSDSLKNQIVTTLADKRSAGKRIRPLDPVYVSLKIGVDLFIDKSSPALLVEARAQAALLAAYADTVLDFNTLFDLQDLYETLVPSIVPGVSRAFVTQFTIAPYAARHINKPTSGDGTVEGITLDATVAKRREYLIRVTTPVAPFTCPMFSVYERLLGVATTVTDTSLEDEAANFVPNELVTGGFVLHPRPEETDTTYPITGNTSNVISVSSGLLVYLQATDSYVVERKLATLGRILRTTTTATVTADTALPVADSTNFQVGDSVLVRLGVASYTVTVSAIPDGTHLTVNTALTLTASGATVDCLWVSPNDDVSFAVIQGASLFSAGDEMYVDTYPNVADLQIRPENFPTLRAANITINPIGGVK